jgi:uncharacterized protein (UPF0305 family)
MSRSKGTGKTGGRAKGTPNKVTTGVREWIAGLIDKNRRQMERDLRQLESKDRLIMFERLMQYVVPKMQNITAKIDLDRLSDEQLDSVINELTKDIENE